MPNGNLNDGMQALKKRLESGEDKSAAGVMQMVQFIAQQQQILLGHFGTLQQQVENSQQSIKQLVTQLKGSKEDGNNLVKQMNGALEPLTVAGNIAKQLSRIEKDLGAVPRTVPKDIEIPDNGKQLAKLEEMMTRLPTEMPEIKDNDALMGEIRDSLLMLFEKPPPESVKSDIMSIIERMNEKRNFDAIPVRDNEGFIEVVEIRQV